jgi:hypothetical protein
MFPKALDREREVDAPPNMTPWHMPHPRKPRYDSQLTKVPSAVKDSFKPETTVNTIDDSVTSPLKNEEIFDIHIPTRIKTETAKQYKEQHQSTLQDKKHLCLYTDASLLEGWAGVGVFTYQVGQVVQ